MLGTRYESSTDDGFVIKLETARSLGLTIPSSLLLQLNSFRRWCPEPA